MTVPTNAFSQSFCNGVGLRPVLTFLEATAREYVVPVVLLRRTYSGTACGLALRRVRRSIYALGHARPHKFRGCSEGVNLSECDLH